MKAKNPVEQILDEKNLENIVLYDDNGKPVEFEQVAVIPLDETNKLYAILIPLAKMEGVGEGEGVLFEIDEENADLQVVKDENVIDKVLTKYEELIGEGDSNN